MRVSDKYYILSVAFIIVFFYPFVNGFAQISDSLYHTLSVKIRPHNQQSLTISDIRQILSNASNHNNEVFRTDLDTLANILKRQTERTTVLESKVEDISALANYYSTYSTDSSIAYHKKLIEYAGNNKNFANIKGNSLLIIASMYSYQDKFDLAINAIHQSEATTGLQKDSSYLRELYSAYCLMYLRLQLYEKAVLYGNAALKWYSRAMIGDEDHTQQILTNAINYSLIYNQKKQIEYLDTAYSITYDVMRRKKSDSAYWFGACYYFLGYFNYLQHNYQYAIAMLDSSMMPVYNYSSKYIANNDYGRYLYKAVCLLEIGEAGKAIAIIDTLKIGSGRYSSKQVLYQALYKYAAKKGNFKDAYLYHLKYTLYSDSLDIQGQVGKVFEADQKYSVAEKQAAIARLENEGLKKAKDRNRLVSFAVVIAMLLLAIIVALYLAYKKQQFKRISDRRRLTDELHTIEVEMQQRQQRDIEEKNNAMLEQRKSISRNMHDELSSGLAALSFFVGDIKSKVQDSYDRRLFEEVEEEAQSMYRNARDFMHKLFNNTASVQNNVPDFLRSLSSRFSSQDGLLVTTNFDEADINSHLSALQHSELYCIIREAVANGLKYADASLIQISIEKRNSILYFEIKDNGKGIDNEKNGLGIGMASMKERATSLNGSLQFDTSSMGTTVSGNFPLKIE